MDQITAQLLAQSALAKAALAIDDGNLNVAQEAIGEAQSAVGQAIAAEQRTRDDLVALASVA